MRRHERARVFSTVAVEADVADRVEVGEELVVVLLEQRIIFVVVALGTAQSQAEHRLAERLHAIRVVVREVLLGDRPSFVRHHIVPLKARGDQLRWARAGQQIASELIEQKLVVRHVAVKGLNHPVTPQPHVPPAVDREAVGVGVT